MSGVGKTRSDNSRQNVTRCIQNAVWRNRAWEDISVVWQIMMKNGRWLAFSIKQLDGNAVGLLWFEAWVVFYSWFVFASYTRDNIKQIIIKLAKGIVYGNWSVLIRSEKSLRSNSSLLKLFSWVLYSKSSNEGWARKTYQKWNLLSRKVAIYSSCWSLLF